MSFRKGIGYQNTTRQNKRPPPNIGGVGLQKKDAPKTYEIFIMEDAPQKDLSNVGFEYYNSGDMTIQSTTNVKQYNGIHITASSMEKLLAGIKMVENEPQNFRDGYNDNQISIPLIEEEENEEFFESDTLEPAPLIQEVQKPESPPPLRPEPVIQQEVVYEQPPVVYEQPPQVVYQQPPVVYEPPPPPVVYEQPPPPVVYEQPPPPVVYEPPPPQPRKYKSPPRRFISPPRRRYEDDSPPRRKRESHRKKRDSPKRKHESRKRHESPSRRRESSERRRESSERRRESHKKQESAPPWQKQESAPRKLVSPPKYEPSVKVFSPPKYETPVIQDEEISPPQFDNPLQIESPDFFPGPNPSPFTPIGESIFIPDVREPEPEPEPVSEESCIDRSLLKLRPHQRLVVEYLQTHRGAIAAHGVGSGKTLTAVTASQCILQEHPTWWIVIVTPPSLVDNFKKEITAYGADPYDKRYIFYTVMKLANDINSGKFSCKNDMFLIVDEAHKLKRDLETNQSENPHARTVLECAKKCNKVLLLTATPVYDSPEDVFNLVSIIKGVNPPTAAEIKYLSKDDDDPNRKQEFKKYFECMFSFYDEEDPSKYPVLVNNQVTFTMKNMDYYREYMRIEQIEVKPGEIDPRKFLAGLRMATNSIEPCLKCNWVAKHVKIWLNEGRKVAIYSNFIRLGLVQIKKRLDLDGIPNIVISGKTVKPADRQREVDRFNSLGPQNVILLSPAGGEGLDLKGVERFIMLEPQWNRAKEEQAVGRARRFESHTHLPLDRQVVEVYSMVVKKPIYIPPGEPVSTWLSADDLVQSFHDIKIPANEAFLAKLEALSIDRLEACP